MNILDLRSRAARAEHAWTMARRALTAAYGRLTRAEALGHQNAEAAAQARAAGVAVRAAEREVDDCFVALF